MTKHRLFTTKIWLLIILLALVAEYIYLSAETEGIVDKIKTDILAEAIPEASFLDDSCSEDISECEDEFEGFLITIQTKNHYYELKL